MPTSIGNEGVRLKIPLKIFQIDEKDGNYGPTLKGNNGVLLIPVGVLAL
jgi:hypothetical protein